MELYVNAFSKEFNSFNGDGCFTKHADYIKRIYAVLEKYDFSEYAARMLEKLATGKGNDFKRLAFYLSNKPKLFIPLMNQELKKKNKRFYLTLKINIKSELGLDPSEEMIVPDSSVNAEEARKELDDLLSLHSDDKTISEEERDLIIKKTVDELTADYGDSDAQSEWEHFHFCISHYNWDWGMEFPKALIDHPDCDKATALLIFWYASPSYYLKYHKEKYNKSKLRVFSFLNTIVKKYLNNEFKTEKIKFDPKDDQGTNWTKDALKTLNNSGWVIPEIMFEATKGRIVGSD